MRGSPHPVDRYTLSALLRAPFRGRWVNSRGVYLGQRSNIQQWQQNCRDSTLRGCWYRATKPYSRVTFTARVHDHQGLFPVSSFRLILHSQGPTYFFREKGKRKMQRKTVSHSEGRPPAQQRHLGQGQTRRVKVRRTRLGGSLVRMEWPLWWASRPGSPRQGWLAGPHGLHSRRGAAVLSARLPAVTWL